MIDNDTNNTLIVGDLVRLPSGGPFLTVCKMEGPSAVSCVWFDDAGSLRREMLPVACLVHVQSKDDIGDDHTDNEVK
jgi:uncharacterized protein YodC (DUF2158 family)